MADSSARGEPLRAAMTRARWSLSPLAQAFLVLGVAAAFGASVGQHNKHALGALAAVLILLVGLIAPRFLFWSLILAVALFSEGTFGLKSPTFSPDNYVLPGPLKLNVEELLVYLLAAILVARSFLGVGRRRLPGTVAVPALLYVGVYALQLARALMQGVPLHLAFRYDAASFVLAGVVALWCFVQVLRDETTRLWLLDVLFAADGGLAVYALARYFFGNGDPQNVYGAKVALWQSASHLLFAFLIGCMLAAWITSAVGTIRLRLWLLAAIPMLLTIVFSFRRTGWIGLVLVLLTLGVISLRRSGRAVAALLVTAAVVVCIAKLSYERFQTGGSLVTRLFGDVVSTSGPTRQMEWGSAWQTISRNVVVGPGLVSQRAASLYATWDQEIVHNGFLFMWMKTGLVGLVPLMVAAVACVVYATRVARSAGREAYIGIALVAVAPYVLLEMMTFAPPIEVRHTVLYALFGALAIALSGDCRQTE
jgi:O-antigen ligase